MGVWDDVNKGGTNKKKVENKPMGSALFEVGEVLGSRGSTKAKKLRSGGTLFARITTAPTQQMGNLHLKLQGNHLKNLDGLFGRSDPFFVISSKVTAAGGLTWQPVYRSEPIMNNLNPVWPACSIDVARLCDGDLRKPILVEVFDWDKKGKHTLIGKFETAVEGLTCAVVEENIKTPNLSKAFTTIKMKRETGKIIVTKAYVEGYVAPNTSSAVQSTTTMPQQQQEMAPAHNNHVSSSSNTHAELPSFSGALNRPPPTFQTTATMMTAAAAISSNPNLSNPQVPYVPSAPMASPIISHHNTVKEQIPRPKFTDYLTGGCEVELTIAIDFTGSNGDPRKPGTLHYKHPDNRTLNDYEKAITAVGGVLSRYDTDQKFSVFGFGAKYGGVIQHCFQVGNSDELDGLLGVLEAYRNVFRTGLTMSGPTVFAEVIDYAAATARSRQEESLRIGKQSYKVLLILTDGEVSDMELTKRAIHAASDAPLSIVIVGIGNADFGLMNTLDDFQNDGILTGGRDIVQFVPFSQHMHDRSSLTRATLEELPDQMVDYFTSRNILPFPPIRGSQLNLLEGEDPTDEDIDLTIEVNPDGEISLANYDRIPTYDDTQYNTFSDYSTIAPVPVPTVAPPAPQPYVVQAQPYVPAARSVAPVLNYFHVQVPPNSVPGMQLQIQNPKTQQMMIVTIPNGIPPGGTFAVQY